MTNGEQNIAELGSSTVVLLWTRRGHRGHVLCTVSMLGNPQTNQQLLYCRLRICMLVLVSWIAHPKIGMLQPPVGEAWRVEKPCSEPDITVPRSPRLDPHSLVVM